MSSYRFSYPLYLDVSEHKQNHFNSVNKINGYQREGNPSPTTALINLNAFYETMIANTQSSQSIQNSALFANKSQVSSLGIANNMYYSSQLNPSQKLSADNSSKSSFSIEAILGLRNRQNNYLIVNDDNHFDFDPSKYRPDYKLSNQLSPKPNNYQKEKSLSSVSPDSTAKEHLLRYNQRSKSKNSSTNLVRLQTNNKRSIESSETKTNSGKMDLNERLSHNSIPQSKSKRVRTIFTPEQLEKLEAEFERQQYMVGPERLYLASALNLSEAQVKVWFQNRRIKWRKQHLEMEHATLKKSCHNIDSTNTEQLAEHEIGSSQEQFKSFKSVDNDSDFLCQSPDSVDVLH